jgi:hypothetical protein
MSRLDDYRSALLVAFPEAGDTELIKMLDARGSQFASFIIDHGLGPLWHERTGRNEFLDCRRAAEALYLAQAHTIDEIGSIFETAGIAHAVIKGAANRLQLYENPALRACHDIDLLVGPDDRVKAASAFASAGFKAVPKLETIGHELELSRDLVTVDLHWGLMREGRLREDPTRGMLQRCSQSHGTCSLSAEDALFLLLVHPAFAKYLAAWNMGLHRVADIVAFIRTQSFDWSAVCAALERNGVRAAAWATLRWVELLAGPHRPVQLEAMCRDLAPGRMRRAWLDRWLSRNFSERFSTRHWIRLLGLSPFLHDTLADASRALAARRRAHARRDADLAAFGELLGQ